MNTRNFGMLLLCVYLFLMGLMAVTSVAVPALLVGIVAIAAGVLLLVGK